jgi:hypothetical protein
MRSFVTICISLTLNVMLPAAWGHSLRKKG